MEFKTVTLKDGARLRRYYKTCDYGLCEYSVGTKLMWGRELHPAYAEVAGCLIVRNYIDGRVVFDYPVASPEGDMEAALAAIEGYCIENGIPPVLSVVPEAGAMVLLPRYPFCRVSNVRTWRDYVYEAEKLRGFAGRKYAGQRNHINKFNAQYPTAAFRELGKADRAEIDAFWADYDAVFHKPGEKAKRELAYAKRLLRQAGSSWFRAGGMEYEGKLISLCLTERCGDTLVIHIEKALYGFDGVYPATVQKTAQLFAADVRWINREDDAADRGLRTSKLQYLPAKLGSKYCMELHNELSLIAEIPTLHTERLTLDEIREEDAADYYALCMDRERNVYWGYDDPAGVEGTPCQQSFLRIVQKDFAQRQGISFAVRLDGKLIGETVLYRFDYRGGAEEGCRIAPGYGGNGYGAEAFAAVAEWALYKIHMNHIVAKCFKENAPSQKMLSSCMRKCGADATYLYFEKKV
ncbi:MAG: GNAT family N-acetyltransferase [Oscillospiraceae bacterium]